MSMTTTGYAALAAGEGWRYVGETDQPAFENGWGNLAGETKLAFRIRESGVVDVHGAVVNGTPDATIVTLPEGYRPNYPTAELIRGINTGSGDNVIGWVRLSPDGTIAVESDGQIDIAVIVAQFFLDLPVPEGA